MNERIMQLRQTIDDMGIDAAVLQLPENVLLFSKHWPQNGFSFIYIPCNGQPCLIVPEAEVVLTDDIDVRVFGWTRVFDGDQFESIYSIIRELRQRDGISDGACIAVELDYDTMAPPLCSGEILLVGQQTIQMYRRAFDTKHLLSAREMIYKLRAVKMDDEIEALRLCNRVALKGIRCFRETIDNISLTSRKREIDVSREVEAYIAQQAAYMPDTKFCRAWAQISSGLKTANAWFPGMISSSRYIENGDIVMLELAVVLNGFWCDLTETVVCGTCNSSMDEAFSIVREAQRMAICGVRHGISACAVDALARDFIKKAGCSEYFVHITGHGTGFKYHEAYPTLGPQSKDIIKTGMVFSVEPAIYIKGRGGVRFERNVLAEDERGIILGEEE